MEKKFSLGVLYMLLSAMGISLTLFFSKLALLHLSLSALIFYRFLASLIITFFFLWLMGRIKNFFPIQNIKINLVRAFFVLLAQYSLFYYLQTNSLLNATVLLNTGPLFIPIIERVFQKYKIGKSTWIGVLISFIGVLFILQPQEGLFSWSSLIGLMAGIGQGASQVLFAMHTKEEKPEVGVLYLFIFCTVVSFFPYIIFRSQVEVDRDTLFLIIFYLVFLGVATMSNQLFRGAAYQHGRPSNLAAFLYISVPLSGLIDWLVLQKTPNALTLLGGLLVIMGGILKIVLRHYIVKKQIK